MFHGRSQDFQRGGHTESYRGYSPDCHLNIVGCLLTKRLTKGGSRAPQDPPGYALVFDSVTCVVMFSLLCVELCNETFYSFIKSGKLASRLTVDGIK